MFQHGIESNQSISGQGELPPLKLAKIKKKIKSQIETRASEKTIQLCILLFIREKKEQGYLVETVEELPFLFCYYLLVALTVLLCLNHNLALCFKLSQKLNITTAFQYHTKKLLKNQEQDGLF